MADPKTAHRQNTLPLSTRVLNMAGFFENSAYVPQSFSGVSNNFDGEGISIGALQQNIGRGSLQPLLKKLDQEHPEVLQSAFGEDYHSLHRMLKMPHDSQLEWAKQIQRPGEDGINPWSRWKREFQALGRTPEYQQIQIGAADTVYRKSLQLCKQFGLKSERGVAFMFDIVTQNGGIEKRGLHIGRDIQQEIDALKRAGKDSEEARMATIAKHRTAACHPRWRLDALKRKMTIARGHGVVHEHRIDLEKQFGITLAPAQDLEIDPPTATEGQKRTLPTTTEVQTAACRILEKCGSLEKGVASYKGNAYCLQMDQEGLTITHNDQVIYKKTDTQEINKLQFQDVQAITAASNQVKQQPAAAETYAKWTQTILQKAGQPERDTVVYRGKGYEFMRSDEGLRVRRDGAPIFVQTPQGETTLNKLTDLDALVFKQIAQRVTQQRDVFVER